MYMQLPTECVVPCSLEMTRSEFREQRQWPSFIQRTETMEDLKRRRGDMQAPLCKHYIAGDGIPYCVVFLMTSKEMIEMDGR